jgi:hypothetical protein
LKKAREILVERLHRLMEAKGWRRPDGEWNIAELHKKTGGSRRWLYRLISGQSNFSIDEYERVLWKGFDLSFETIMASAAGQSSIDRDVEDLFDKLASTVSNAKRTGTLEAVRFGLYAMADKTALDRAMQEKLRASISTGPTSEEKSNLAPKEKKRAVGSRPRG